MPESLDEIARASVSPSAQCPSCQLHELVPVVLAHQPGIGWMQVGADNALWAALWRRRASRARSREKAEDTPVTTVQIDACPVCMGAWFDNGELDVLSQQLELEGIEQVLAPEQQPGHRPCPLGHGLMVEQMLPGLIRTPVDRCLHCNGIWLDGHERRKLAKATTSEGQGDRTQRWIKRGAIWAAQVLTQLPVEVDNPARSTPWVIYGLLLSLLTVFLLQIYGPIDTYTWALVPGRLRLEHDGWTLLTSMFMHGTWAHILSNCYFLYVFGDNVEHLFGRLRFVAFYLAAGLVGGLAQAWLTTKTALPVVGASGCIAGVLGAYLWAFPRQRLFQVILWIQIKVPIWIYLFVWVGLHLLMGLFGTGEGAEGVAWFAHLGGFCVGLAVTPLVLARRRAEVASRVAVPARAPPGTAVAQPSSNPGTSERSDFGDSSD